MFKAIYPIQLKQSTARKACCQSCIGRSVGTFDNLVTDWVEDETAFLYVFHPITPSTTVNMCIVPTSGYLKVFADRPYHLVNFLSF
jgi:hypothetical protein